MLTMTTTPATNVMTDFRAARPEIIKMRALIANRGFFMMGATQISYRNQDYLLSWRMGSGAKCQAVRMYYDPGLDVYTLEFLKSITDLSNVQRVDLVYAEDVVRLIEQKTGFYLRI